MYMEHVTWCGMGQDKETQDRGGGGAFIDEAICLHMGLDATAQRLCNSHLEAVQHLNTQLLNVVRILSISLRYAAPARIMRRVGERSTVTTESSTRVPTAPSGVLHCRVHPARTATKQTNSMVTSVTVVSVGKPGDIRSSLNKGSQLHTFVVVARHMREHVVATVGWKTRQWSRRWSRD
jgi:hypothetical protein